MFAAFARLLTPVPTVAAPHVVEPLEGRQLLSASLYSAGGTETGLPAVQVTLKAAPTLGVRPGGVQLLLKAAPT
ncbi:MAG TPA: hypothetical protein VF796_29730 [Humisphaera sp.]